MTTLRKIGAVTMFTVLSLICTTCVSSPLNAKELIRAERTVPTPADSANLKIIEMRLRSIDSLDKSTLNSAEKKNLRAEVKELKARSNALGGTVYLSAAAIILLIILVVVLL